MRMGLRIWSLRYLWRFSHTLNCALRTVFSMEAYITVEAPQMSAIICYTLGRSEYLDLIGHDGV